MFLSQYWVCPDHSSPVSAQSVCHSLCLCSPQVTPNHWRQSVWALPACLDRYLHSAAITSRLHVQTTGHSHYSLSFTPHAKHYSPSPSYSDIFSPSIRMLVLIGLIPSLQALGYPHVKINQDYGEMERRRRSILDNELLSGQTAITMGGTGSWDLFHTQHLHTEWALLKLKPEV